MAGADGVEFRVIEIGHERLRGEGKATLGVSLMSRARTLLLGFFK
jgi:hypothetical protein